MTKEEDGKVVPCTREESILKFFNKLSSVGGNPATQSIKCFLFDADGNIVKIDEVKKNRTEYDDFESDKDDGDAKAALERLGEKIVDRECQDKQNAEQ